MWTENIDDAPGSPEPRMQTKIINETYLLKGILVKVPILDLLKVDPIVAPHQLPEASDLVCVSPNLPFLQQIVSRPIASVLLAEDEHEWQGRE
jgi:hypothetical protein